MIMWSRVAQLKDEIGAEDFGEIVTLFLEEVEEVIARLRLGLDPGTIGADLHFLKGSALNLGFRAFADLCQEGETAARLGKAGPLHIARAITCFEASKAAFLAGLSDQDNRRAG